MNFNPKRGLLWKGELSNLNLCETQKLNKVSHHFEKAFPSRQKVLLVFFDGLRLQILKNVL